jgi:hypothetical protein
MIYYIGPRNTIETDVVIRLTVTNKGVKPLLDRHTTGFWKEYKWFRSQIEAENYLKEIKKLT